MISPLFTTIVLCALFIWLYMRYTSKHAGDKITELLEKEHRANSTRKQSLASLEYINFAESCIPFTDPAPNEYIAKLQDTLRGLTLCKIVNLTGISNTDLKLTYGPANLPILTELDQNFTSLTMALNDLGTELNAIGDRDNAIKVLDYAVSIGSDISNTYINLANIYVEAGNYDAIQQLINRAGNIRSLTKQSTINKLTEILDSHTAIVIAHPSDTTDAPDNILPKDILDILETVPYSTDDQK